MTYLDYLILSLPYLLRPWLQKWLARKALLSGGHSRGPWALAETRRSLLTLEVHLN